VGTKSSAGVRTVPILPPLARLLAEHALASGRPSGAALVLTRDGRRPANPDSLRSRARRAWEEAGLERLRPHQGRHSAITAFLVGGAPGKVVQAVAGHSTITTTMDTYGHVLDHNLHQLGAAFDRTAEAARARRTS
jgi:integrase